MKKTSIKLFFFYNQFVKLDGDYIKKGLAMSLLFLAMFAFNAQINAQTRPTELYVDASYTGATSDGTEASPFTTISDALAYRGNTLGNAGMVSDEKIIVKAGTYAPADAERIFLTSTNGGTSSYSLSLEAQGDVYLDGTNLYGTKFAAMIAITAGAENVIVKGFKIKSLRNNQSLASTVDGVIVKDGKFGIQIANTASNIQILDNEIYDFSWTLDVDPMKNRLDFTAAEIAILQAADPGDNSGPINVVGTDLTPITGLVIKNNYIHNVIPGWTEGIQVNGNVDGFEISDNTISEVQNIGIVVAGHYGWVPNIDGATVTDALNYARNGVIKNNTVSSCRSPIAAAAGIYCDGSQNVIVENNSSSDGQVGFSIGNENSNSNSGGHIVRNNLSYDNSWAGIIMGVPAAASNSYIDDVSVTGNTMFRNGGVTDTYLGYMGASECIINKNIQNLEIENNIFYATNHNFLVSFAMPFDAAMVSYVSTISFDYNIYYTNSTDATPLGVFDWSQLGTGYDYYGTFDWYRVNRTDQDLNSSFVNPDFADITSINLDLSVQSTSPAINSGNPAYTVASGELDFAGNARANGTIDIGAYEFGSTSTCEVSIITPYVNTPYLFSLWQQKTEVSEAETRPVWLKLETTDVGTWSWTGPNGFTDNDNIVYLNNISVADAGTYTGTFTNECGEQSSQTFTVTVNASCNDAELETYYGINADAEVEDTAIQLNDGDYVYLSPQSDDTSGTWSWTGPNGYTSSNQVIDFDPITTSDAGDYTVTYTLGSCSDTATYSISINGSTNDVFPDPTKTYYIDCPVHNLRLAATGESEDPYTTSTSTTGDDVAWKFVAKGNGYWHIQRDAGGSKPRLRTDNSSLSDMQPTSSSGSYTYFELTEGNTSGTYHVTLPNGPNSYKRLQITNTGVVKMVPSSYSGNWVSFEFTEISGTGAKSTDTEKIAEENLQVYPNPVGDMLTLSFSNGLNISKIEIIDITGKRQFIKNISENKTAINMQNISSGLYFIRMFEGDKFVTAKKLIKN